MEADVIGWRQITKLRRPDTGNVDHKLVKNVGGIGHR